MSMKDAGPDARPEKLRRRRDFLAAARGVFRAMPLIVVQMRKRGDGGGPPRIGFTATKRIGNAVIRNRARRRMREAVRAMPDDLLLAGHDYVFIAREDTAQGPFSQLKRQTARALEKLRAGEGYAARARGAKRAGAKSAKSRKQNKGERP